MRHCRKQYLTPLTLALVTIAALAGCSPLKQEAGPGNVYRLSPEALPGEVIADLPKPLTLDEVIVPSALKSDRIVVARANQRLDQYADTRWAAPLPATLTDAVARLLQDAAFVDSPDAATDAGHYRLRLRVRDFQAYYAPSQADEPPELQVTLVLSLIDPNGGLTGTSRIEQRRQAKANRLDIVVKGLGRLLRDGVREGLDELTAQNATH